MNDFIVNFEVPKGYTIDQNESTKDRLVLKREHTYPKTWGEFISRNPISDTEYYIDCDSIVKEFGYTYDRTKTDKNLCKTKEEAEAFLALIQLKRLWHEYVDEHKDEYFDYSIILVADSYKGYDWIVGETDEWSIFSFPTDDMAQEFLDNFKDLFIKIVPLFTDPK